MDSSPAPSFPPARGSTALDRSTAAATPVKPSCPAFLPVEEALLTVLLKKGLLSTEQVRIAQVYGQEHNRDLRQSILELNLISPDLLNHLAFERLSALATDNGEPQPSAAGLPASLSPNRTQHHRDVRKELQEKAGDRDLVGAGQPDPRARLRLPGHRHSFRSSRERLAQFATASTASSRISCSLSRPWPHRSSVDSR